MIDGLQVLKQVKDLMGLQIQWIRERESGKGQEESIAAKAIC
jgi:hypothetical protein